MATGHDEFAYRFEADTGRCLGFAFARISTVDLDDDKLATIWDEDGPRLDVPLLGLVDVTAGQVVDAAAIHYGSDDTLNRRIFNEAIECDDPEREADLWRMCLEAGDGMAHYGLGHALHELGRYREAYAHLRHYAEIAPFGSWPWCWLGRAAEAIGELDEAESAYRRALAQTDAGEEETDAPELLAALVRRREQRAAPARRPPGARLLGTVPAAGRSAEEIAREVVDIIDEGMRDIAPKGADDENAAA